MEGWACHGRAKVSRIGAVLHIIALFLSHGSYGRSLQAAMPAPAPAPSGKRAHLVCYECPASSDHSPTA